LMLSTTYSRFTELQLNLPNADAVALKDRPQEILIAVAQDGRTRIDRQEVDGRSVVALTAELAAAAKGRPEAVVVISADALATHQAVVNVLDAARRAGLNRLTFAAQGQASDAAAR
jgi:biopolymer transport protein ExbD